MASWQKIARRIRVPLGFLFAIAYIWLARPSTLSILIGVVLVLAGLAIRALASGHVQKNELLAVTGPYAYTRNPLYLGSIVLACGFLVAARSWWLAAVAIVLLLAIYLPVIQSEEKFLSVRFPEFQAYAQRVPRFFPRIRRNQSSTGRFSWHLYWKHREYNATIGAALMVAALIAKSVWLKR